ncbi:MAG: antibiotic biosynthesis monooxygenase [Chloroflexi bacterium]|nr:antibiotic biosynthesis monooxygenase [Chloroflexota bacterium]
MYVTMNHIPVAAGNEDAFEARFAARPRLVDQVPGFRSFELLRPQAGPPHGIPRGNEYLVLTRWDDRASFEAWANGSERRAGHRRAVSGPELTTGPSWLTTHEVFEAAHAGDWQETAAHAELPVAMMNVVDVARGSEAFFEEVFRTREGGVEDQPGFLSLEVLRPVVGTWESVGAADAANGSTGSAQSGPESATATAGTTGSAGSGASTYVVFSRWASAEYHAAWTRSEAFRRAHGRRRLPEGAVVRASRIVLPAYASAHVAVG